MKIETKYNIGDKIWVVYKDTMMVGVYEDEIKEISYNNDGLLYITEKVEALKEDEIILYEDKSALLIKIQEIMNEIKQEEQH